MCGRFTLRASAGTVAEQSSVFEIPPWKARYNIAPSQTVAAVRWAFAEATPGRELAWLRWGLIPGWATDPTIGNRLINVRADTVTARPAFRAAFRGRRCLVEAKTAVDLLKTIVLKGRLVTGDAMFCQRELCQQIVDSGGDYLFVVKDNQPELKAAAAIEVRLFDIANGYVMQR